MEIIKCKVEEIIVKVGYSYKEKFYLITGIFSMKKKRKFKNY